MKTKERNIQFVLAFAVLFLLFLGSASAADGQILDKVDQTYKALASSWFQKIVGYSWGLFWKLALIDVIWTGITVVRDRKEFGEIITTYVNKSITIGFFAVLLQFANKWIPQIIDSFTQIGKAACGSGCSSLTPDGIIIYGLKAARASFEALSGMGYGDKMLMALPIAFTALILVIGFAVVAGQLLVTLLESYVTIGGGVIMLGFGGSRWTSDMASSYLKFAIGTGVKLMLCYMIVGAGISAFEAIPTMLKGVTSASALFSNCLVLVIQTVVFVYLAWTIPSLASGMLSGAPSSSLGGMMAAATTVGAAAVGTTALAGGAAKGAATSTMGAGKAVGAGFNAARSAGMGVGAAAAASVPMAVKSLGGNAASSMKSSVGKAVDSTAGGRAAASLNAKSAASSPSTGSTSGGSNSGGGASPSSGSSAAAPSSGSSAQASSDKPSSQTPASSPVSDGGDSSAASSSGQPSSANMGNDAFGGNASSASISGSGNPPGQQANISTPAANKQKLSDTIKGLDKFIHQDAAQVHTPGITLSHGKD